MYIYKRKILLSLQGKMPAFYYGAFSDGKKYYLRATNNSINQITPFVFCYYSQLKKETLFV